jgi:ABC-type transporter Mla subunit MlaD
MTAATADMTPARREQAHLTGWMWGWIALGTLVALVVVAFLIPVVVNLRSIDAGLATARHQVTGIRVDVKPLPGYVADINESLAGVNQALDPLPGQLDKTVGYLGSVRDSLTGIDGSLGQTSGTLSGISASLVDTANTLDATDKPLGATADSLNAISASLLNSANALADTSNILATVNGTAGTIHSTLETAENPADTLGAAGIYQRVAKANDPLSAAKGDTGNIVNGLGAVNGHLRSICLKIPVPTGC